MTQSKRRSFWLEALRTFWPFLIPLVVLVPGLQGFPFPAAGEFSDLAITHYPNALFLKNALAQGVVPLWSPQILSGFPFIAHPYSGLWYPPYWFGLLFPLPLGLNLLVAVHFVWAGVGVYKLVRQSGLGHEASLLAGLAFEAAPKLFAHLGAGHLMLLMAVAWTPWLLWAIKRPVNRTRLGRLVQPALILALIFFADPRWAIYTGILWLAWAVVNREGFYAIAKRVLLATGVAAPAILLYGQYALLSTRAALAAGEVLELSLPTGNLLGLVLPQWGGFHEWIVYPGVLVLLLAIVAKPWQANGRKDSFWLGVLFVAILISIGSAIPGAEGLAQLPGFSQLRIPPRALFLAALAFAWLAGAGLQSLLEVLRPIRITRLASAGLLMGLSLFGVMAFAQASVLWKPAALVSLVVVNFLVGLELLVRRRVAPRILAIFLIGLVLADLLIANFSLVRFRSKTEVLSQGSAIAEFLADDPGMFRVYSPTYSLPQQTGAAYGIQLANGVDPLQLASYVRFFAQASRFPQQGYSVAQPPQIGSDNPSEANKGYQPDARSLGLLNVKYVVSSLPMEVEGLRLAAELDGGFVYQNEFVQPRAWLENGGSVQITRWNYNQIEIEAEGPGLLVVSEIAYPGWKVAIDSKPLELGIYQDIFRSVELPPGRHLVSLSFFPDLLWGGMITSLVTFSFILIPRRIV